ncbi:hypothetical protein DICVIV_04117 [Dictyocaulus viviparus]|uniref:Uncharacterized protein n=1 Tax=Dictyocaulus viviparus TaxID=29172 RepID=A0A0D8Y0W2_DICVI|nr:hypothetical protein DICVIV_04117 [Dictyocaulus viviparus]
MSVGFLQQSDDSDDGESEEISSRRRFFQKTKRRFFLNSRFFEWFLLCLLSCSVVYIALNIYNLSRRYSELSRSVSAITILANRIDVLESNLEKLYMEFDLWKENGSVSKNSSRKRSTTDYVYDIIEKLTIDMRQMKKSIDHAFSVADDVTRRLTTIETRCLAVCHQTNNRDRDKQRRSQATTAFLGADADDEIVFQRN